MSNKMHDVVERHREKLLGIPGVTGVAVGKKVIAGRETPQRAIVVFVRKKRSDVSDAERIPTTIDGTPTDVVEREFDIVDL